MSRGAREFEPKLVTVLREGYTLADFGRDGLAGLVVGIVALPLAIANAIASGVRPEQGLFTAIVAGFLISALGGSRVQIGGPTGAFVIIVAGVVDEFGYEGLAVATMMAGVMLVVMGIARLGAVIRYIPYPVTVGFTSGIALIIALGQVRDALGLHMERVPADSLEKIQAYGEHIGSFGIESVLICLATIAIIQFWPLLTRRIPGPLIALLATTLAVQLFDLPVDTIGGRFGEVPNVLPKPAMPAIDWSMIGELSSPAIAIALLAGIESLLSAMVADGMTGGRHRSNTELIAQGIANIASPLFGGIPATGAIARTATNIRNGGRSPIAGIVHAVVLLVILLAAGPMAVLIPMATLAGILLVVAYNMSEWHNFVRLLRGPRSDVLVLLATFLLTVFVDLTVALEVGIVLAALLLMKRLADVTSVSAMRSVLDYEEAGEKAPAELDVPAGVDVFEINGSLCFGAASKFTEMAASIQPSRVMILRMRHVLAVDATGLQAVESVWNRMRQQGTLLLISGVRAQPLEAMRRIGLLKQIGEEHVFAQFNDALARARQEVEHRPEVE
ncbi:MAG: SulP family inorganic anion transporter [Rhodothermales bacterium]|nr:SulP family inorganic anion transporter [Rhodothermales bacterium]